MRSSTLALVLFMMWVALVVAVFNISLPTMCANPQGNGNYLIQPFCK